MSRRGPFCLCLHEMENDLPRTKRCRVACGAQRSILAEREQELKTSEEWYAECYPNKELIIMDPDGWDRKNYDYSFKEERITMQEFSKRVMMSTVYRQNKSNL